MAAFVEGRLAAKDRRSWSRTFRTAQPAWTRCPSWRGGARSWRCPSRRLCSPAPAASSTPKRRRGACHRALGDHGRRGGQHHRCRRSLPAANAASTASVARARAGGSGSAVIAGRCRTGLPTAAVAAQPDAQRAPQPARILRSPANAPAQFQLLFPTEGAMLSALEPEIRWPAVPGAAYYEAQVVTEEGNVAWSARTDATRIRLPGDGASLRPERSTSSGFARTWLARLLEVCGGFVSHR